MLENIDPNYRCGYVAIVGKANAGKSTLLNNLLNFKLSIVSHKAQTTRKRILGFLSENDFQAIFIDTPGLLKPKYDLQSEMMNYVNNSLDEADMVLFIIDAKELRKAKRIAFEDVLEKVKVPIIALINKIDLMPKDDLLPLISQLDDSALFESIIPISALKEKDLGRITDEVRKLLPLHPPYYDPEILTEQPERFFVSELIREQIFIRFKDEIPYSTEVQIEEFKDRDEGKTYIRAIVFVERDSQKGILIGKKGAALKKIGESSRKSIEVFLDRKIFLELFVKVLPNWRNDPRQLKRLGYK